MVYLCIWGSRRKTFVQILTRSQCHLLSIFNESGCSCTVVKPTPHFTELKCLQISYFSFLRPPPGADGDVDAAAHHITAMFSACNGHPDKPVYHHFTTATDTSSVQVVFHMVIDQVIRDNLEAVELL